MGWKTGWKVRAAMRSLEGAAQVAARRRACRRSASSALDVTPKETMPGIFSTSVCAKRSSNVPEDEGPRRGRRARSARRRGPAGPRHGRPESSHRRGRPSRIRPRAPRRRAAQPRRTVPPAGGTDDRGYPAARHGEHLDTLVVHEDLDLGNVDEGQRHQLVADRAGGLLEGGAGGMCARLPASATRPGPRAVLGLQLAPGVRSRPISTIPMCAGLVPIGETDRSASETGPRPARRSA